MTIEKRYRKNINASDPGNYFENWYANMWRNCFLGAQHVSSSSFFTIFINELSKVGATVSPTDDAYYRIIFDNERDYLMFVLKWS
jgi:hypothetical protein